MHLLSARASAAAVQTKPAATAIAAPAAVAAGVNGSMAVRVHQLLYPVPPPPGPARTQ